MADLKKLRSQRQAFFTHCTKELDTLSSLLETEISDIPACNTVKLSVEKVETYQSKIEQLHSQILDLLTVDSDIDAEVKKHTDYYADMMGTLKSGEVAVASFTSNKLEATENGSSQQSLIIPPSPIHAKLPKLEIHPFDGNPTNWQEFWDLFETTIDKRSDLEQVDKLKYLRSYLQKDALTVVEGFRLTAINYSAVVDCLKERYGNPQLAIFAHLERLLDKPTVQSGDKIRLETIYDECEMHIRSLVALGLSEDTFGVVFTPIILSRLPRSVRIQLHRKNGSAPWTLSNLRTMMRDELQALEMSDRYGSHDQSKSNFNSQSRKDFKAGDRDRKKPFSPTQGALVSNVTLICSFCQGSHYSDQCTKYTTVDQRKQALGKNKCLKCLKPGHVTKMCRRTKQCFYCKGSSHHSSLCFQRAARAQSGGQGNSNLQDKQSSGSSKQAQVGNTSDCALLYTTKRVQMQMAEVHFGDVSARLFFDSGCSRSYITTELASKLCLTPVSQEMLWTARFGQKRRTESTYDVVYLSVPTRSNSVPISALVTNTICSPVQKFSIDPNQMPVLQDLPLADTPSSEMETVAIDMLIGEDHLYDFLGSAHITMGNGMHLIQSKFGYILTGKVPDDNSSNSCNLAMALFRQVFPRGSVSIPQFWSLEDIGVKENPYNSDDEQAVTQFNENVRLNSDGRYEVRWPVKDPNFEIPTNYAKSVGCLRSVISRYRNQPEILEAYSDTICDQKAKGIIEPVPEGPSDNKIHYIPHHAVVRKDKTTTKTRIVYNASTKPSKEEPSLNECLLRGPVLLRNLCGILIRFREQLVALSCDVEKAFLQISLHNDDRDLTRFLWVKDVNRPVTSDNLQEFRFARVPFGFISSPFLLEATILHHLKQVKTKVSTDISQNIYVDNVISGTDSVFEAVEYYKQAKEIFHAIGMNLREWQSNSANFMNQVEYSDRSFAAVPKVLGLKWDTGSDDLLCSGFQDTTVNKVSKRTILQSVSTIFDPCGFFSPVVIRGKLLIQTLWKQKVPWDTPVKPEFESVYKSVSEDLKGIESVPLKRRIISQSPSTIKTCDLLCFCDASGRAYAAALYARIEYRDGRVETNLLFSKTRLAPVQQVSLPRLELLAVLIGVRCSSFLVKESGLPFSRVIIWTDSQCVLSWIQSTRVLTTFVANRIKEIKNNKGYTFRYIPTDLNPADIPSRGSSLDDLRNSTLWWHGPAFLCLTDDTWPENEPCHVQAELLVTEYASATQPDQKAHGIGSVKDISRYSELQRLIRVSAWVLRFISACRSKAVNHMTSLSADEIKASTSEWVKYVQKTNFTGDYTNQAQKLRPYRDSMGIIRCRGRLEFSDLPVNSKEPILLPKSNPFTRLVILDCHAKLFHAGARQTLAQCRYEYWIPSGVSQVSGTLRHCQWCRKVQGCPFKVPNEPPLPWFRVSSVLPFAHVGIDYLGPLFVKQYQNNGTADTVKVWICLFSCAVTRAIHLEVIQDCTTEEFLLALRRFIAHYGSPNVIISDNAKQFKLADETLRKIFQSDMVQEFSANHLISWKFITALAPWMGGFYERLVGSVKRSLKRTLGSTCLTLIQLQTVVAEVASVINSRPLVPGNLDVGEMALTPAHFLAKSGRKGILMSLDPTEELYVDRPGNKEKLLDIWKRGQKLLNQYWASWKTEYLALLRDRPSKNLNKPASEPIPIKTGSIVLIKQTGNRILWPLAEVIEIHLGSDGQIRSAKVRTADNKVIVRSILHLYPIEGDIPPSETPQDQVSPSPASPQPIRRNPRRNAAAIAECKLRDQLGYLEEDISD